MKSNKSVKSIFLVLSAVIMLLAASAAVSANVVINEIMYNPADSDSDKEWIEIYNNGPETVDLTGWKFAEGTSNHNLELKQGTNILEADDYAIIAENSDRFLTDHPAYDGKLFDATFSLSNTGEELNLKSNATEIVDTVNYSKDWNEDQEGYTIELIHSELDNSLGTNWKASTVLGGTPSQQNSVYFDVNEPLIEFAPDFTAYNKPLFPPVTIAKVEICAKATSYLGIKNVNLRWNSGSANGSFAMIRQGTSDVYCRELSSLTVGAIDGMTVRYTLTAIDNLDHSITTEEQSYTYDGLAPIANFECTPITGVESMTTTCTSTSTDTVDSTAQLYHEWTFNGGNPEIVANYGLTSVEVAYNTAGTYDVSLTVTDRSGIENGRAGHMDTETKADYITITDSEPVVDFNYAPIDPEDHEEITFTDLSTAIDEIVSWFWDFGDENTSTEQNPTHGYDEQGDYEVTLTVTDNDGSEDSATQTVSVTEINDAPVVSGIEDQTITEQQNFATFNLDEFLTEVDGDAVIWTYSGNVRLTVTIDENNVVTIAKPSDLRLEEGEELSETITFTATDDNEEALFDSDEAVFTVTGIDNAPIVGDIPDQNKTEGQTFTTFDLDTYLTELDDETVTWSYAGNDELVVSINADNVVMITIPNENWFGAETVVFTATDNTADHLSGSDATTFTVTNVNDAPTIELLPGNVFTGDENEEFEINFEMSDIDNEKEELEIIKLIGQGILEDLSNIRIIENDDETYTLKFTPSYDLVQHLNRTREFELVMKVSDGMDETSLPEATITVNDVNQAPEINNAETKVSFLETVETTYQIVGSDADENDEDTLTYSLTDAPVGMTINSSTGLITWTPVLGAETFEDVTVIVTDHPYGAEAGLTSEEYQFDAVVTRLLEISNVEVNGVAMPQGENFTTKPGEDLEVTFTLTNNYDKTITSIDAILDTAVLINGEEFSFPDFTGPTYLEAGRSAQYTLDTALPNNHPEGEYELVIDVAGENELKETISSDYSFLMKVEKDAADVIITDLTLDAGTANTVKCAAETTLTVDYFNRGMVDENDVVITLTGPNGLELSTEDDTDFDATLAQSTGKTYQFNVPTAELAMNANTLTVTITYRGYYEVEETVTLQRSACVLSYQPTATSLILAPNEEQDFSVTLAETGYEDSITWYVNNVEVDDNTDEFTFSEETVGNYVVKVLVDLEAVAESEQSHTWNVLVTDEPYSSDLDISYCPLTFENSYGKIVYNVPIELGSLVNIDEVVSITDGKVAIDTVKAPQLDAPATVTLKKGYQDYLIFKSESFNLGPYTECPATICQAVSSIGNEFVFTVTGFTTYKVESETAADLRLSVAEINFEQTIAGETKTAAVTMTNGGTHDSITGLTAELVEFNSKYQAQLTAPANSLAQGATTSTQLSLTVPSGEDLDKHQIGRIKISATVNGNPKTVYVPVFLGGKTYLSIESIDINGKATGKLKIDEDNTIEVTVKNSYSKDLEDVEVTVTILDVDGDDLDETADEANINKGKSEEFEVTFDLSNEPIEEEKYWIEVTAEGEAEDGTTHTITEKKEVSLDLEKHQVALDKVELGFNVLECSRQTDLRVTVLNQGQEDEDEIEVTVSNSALGMNLRKAGIELEPFIEDDNSETVSFVLDLEDAKAGRYTLNVAVLRDGDADGTQTIDLEVKDCPTNQQTTTPQQTQANAQLAQQLQQQLEQQLLAQQQLTATTKIKTSFRDSNMYLGILFVMICLTFLAMILALVVLVGRKRRRARRNGNERKH